jgi:hypothetical protein
MVMQKPRAPMPGMPEERRDEPSPVEALAPEKPPKNPSPKKAPKKAKKKRIDPAAATPEELARWAAEDTERARGIFEADNILDVFAAAWRKIVAGEEKNAKLLCLAGTSRLFPTCMNVAVKGPSGVGKSNIRRQVLSFFPPEEVISFTTLSEGALLYFEGDFAHKILSMGEASGADEQTLQDYLLRELMSEGRLRYPVVQKVEGVGLTTVIIEKNGPVAFMVTTTKAALNPENETRMLSLEVDDSAEQTRNVLAKVAHNIGMNAEREAINYEPWHAYQRWLVAGNRNVVVPYAAALSKLIPARSVRLRRDFAQVLLALKAHALLHRYQRPVDDRGQIIADIERDYQAVARLMGGIVAEASGAGISKEVQQTIDAVESATKGMPSDEGTTSDKIGKILKLDQSAAWRRLKVALNGGFIVNLETRPRQRGRYRVHNRRLR